MQDIWDILFANPIVGKILSAIIGVIIISSTVRILQRFITKAIHNDDTRYSVRKGLAFTSYIVIIIYVLGVFSDQLGSLAVAFGVAGAGIAFALQEVIVSIAGWIALCFGQFYHVGDRVQLGGIKGVLGARAASKPEDRLCGGGAGSLARFGTAKPVKCAKPNQRDDQ